MRKKSKKIDKVDSILATVDSLNTVVVFSTMLTEAGRLFLAHIGRFFWPPVGMLITIIRTMIAWRKAHLEKYRGNTFQQTVIDTLTNIIFAVVVVGNVCTATLFSACAPEIFIAIMAARLLYNLALIFYNAFKISRLKKMMNNEIQNSAIDNLEHKQKLNNEINNCNKILKENALAFVTGVFAVLAVTLVALFARPVMAIFGIAGGIINIVIALRDCKEILWPRKKPAIVCKNLSEVEMTETPGLTRNAKLLRQINELETASESSSISDVKSDQSERDFSLLSRSRRWSEDKDQNISFASLEQEDSNIRFSRTLSR